ncbi:hypothetical protein L9F63_009302, partial [Diploptera punctata]
ILKLVRLIWTCTMLLKLCLLYKRFEYNNKTQHLHFSTQMDYLNIVQLNWSWIVLTRNELKKCIKITFNI